MGNFLIAGLIAIFLTLAIFADKEAMLNNKNWIVCAGVSGWVCVLFALIALTTT